MLPLALLAAAALAADAPDTIRLAPGVQEVLRLPGLTRVAVSKAEIADVRAVGTELLVLGRQPGRASLTLWVNGKVLVRNVVVDDGRMSELARLVKDNVSPTLKVQQYGSSTVIEGTLDAVEEMDRLKLLVGNDPNVKLLVKMNPYALPFVAQQITQAFEKSGLKTAHAVAIGDRIFLEGSVADSAEMNKASAIAEAIYGRSQSGLKLP